MTLRAHLDPGEEILWTGRPVPRNAAWAGFPGTTWAARGVYLAIAAAAVAPFSMAGVYISWVSVTAFLRFDSIAAMLGAPLLLVFGMTLALTPWYVLARPRIRNLRIARDIWYVITDRRALVALIRGGQVIDEEATWLQSIDAPRLSFELGDGSADVIFASDGSPHPEGGGGWSVHENVGFVGVPDAHEVLTTLQRAIDAGRRDSTGKIC